MNPNVEIRILTFRPNGTYKSLMLEETSPKKKEAIKPQTPKENTQNDKRTLTT